MEVTVNRLEVIDHTPTGKGRDYVKWIEQPFRVSFELQDNSRTLKVFLTPLSGKEENA